MSKNIKTTDPQSQRDRFIETAHALGADEDAFKAKLAVIARQKPKDEPKSPPKRKG